MLFSLLGKKTKPVLERVHADMNTKLRIKYDPYYHAVESAQGPIVRVDGRDMVMMSSNEYLGLSRHPKVIAAAKAALDEWGSSPCGSRLANGTRHYHVELEEALAQFLGKEACHVTVAGYLACVSGLSSLAQRGDALIVDMSIHSALWDGVRLSAATVERFTHEDMNSLELLFKKLDPAQPKIVAVDGIYSMEGHIASLPRLVELCNQYGAVLVVDDAHGVGVLGRDGRGTADHFGLSDEVELIVGSFSKSFASTGGFIAGSHKMIEYLRSNTRQIIFSAAITPAAAASALASLQVMQEEPEHREKLWANVKRMRAILDQLGLDYWNSPSPALPIVIGEKERCYYFWKTLWEQGFFTVMSIAPGVPAGKDLIRTAISAMHTHDQIDRFGEALALAMKKNNISPRT